MSATPSLKITHSSIFKGGARLWSNRYHFNGGVPADSSHWTTFADAVVAAEALASTGAVTIVKADGYEAGSDVAVFEKTYSTVGTAAAGGQIAPGECVALLRWSTPAKSVKNHPIYLFNYFHFIAHQVTGTLWDKLDATQRALLETYAAHWISGFSDGTNTLVRAGPNGVTAGGHFVEEYVTHRDFPYTRSA